MKPKYKIGQTVLYTYTAADVSEQCKFTIKDIELDTWEDEYGKEHPYYVYYDADKSSHFRGRLAECDIEGLAKECIEINATSLKEDGWKFYSEYDGKITGYKKDITYNGKVFYCDIKQDSNTNGRDWSIHVDNDVCNSVGTMDIANFGQLDRFLELLSE